MKPASAALVQVLPGLVCERVSAYVNGQYQGTYYVDCRFTGFGGGGGGGDGPGGIGPGGGGGDSPAAPNPVAGVATENCASDMAEAAAGNVFRGWMQATHPISWISLEPDGDTYTITFQDGKRQRFAWGLPLQASLPLQPTDGVCF